MPKLYYPTPAHRWAASAWERLKLSPPADLRIVCEHLHVRVETTVLPRDILGCYVRTEDGTAMALINSGFPIPRQRFSLAHEICHHLRLATEPGPIRVNCGAGNNSDAEERLCNVFAAELLMPVALVRDLAQELGHPALDKTRNLAHRFEVSIGAMAIRLRELGLEYRRGGHGGWGLRTD